MLLLLIKVGVKCVALLLLPKPRVAGDLDLTTAAEPSCVGDLWLPERLRLLEDSLVSGDLEGAAGLNMFDLMATDWEEGSGEGSRLVSVYPPASS